MVWWWVLVVMVVLFQINPLLLGFLPVCLELQASVVVVVGVARLVGLVVVVVVVLLKRFVRVVLAW
jgi:hypothetical protein